MVIDRLLSLILRFCEFVASIVVVGIASDLIHDRHKEYVPLGRLSYIDAIAVLATIMSLVWLIPTTGHVLNYPADLLFAGAWFAAFGILVVWLHDNGCGGAFHWHGITANDYCGKFKAAEAFSFIAACLFLVSALLGMWAWHRHGRRDEAATTTTTHRRRWGRRNRAVV